MEMYIYTGQEDSIDVRGQGRGEQTQELEGVLSPLRVFNPASSSLLYRLLPLVASLLTSVHSVLPEQTFVLSDVTSVLSRVTSVRSRVTIFSNILGPLFCHVKAVLYLSGDFDRW